MKRSALSVMLVMLVGLFCWQCGGSKPDIPSGDECTWCMKPKISENALYGIGTANVGPNFTLARQRAEDAARHAIGQQVRIKVKSLMDRYTREYNDFIDKKANMSSSEFTEVVSRTVSEAVLTGCRITDYYYDKNANLYYALAELPKENVALDIMNSAREKKALFLREKADEALQKLDKELKNWNLNE